MELVPTCKSIKRCSAYFYLFSATEKIVRDVTFTVPVNFSIAFFRRLIFLRTLKSQTFRQETENDGQFVEASRYIGTFVVC